MENHISAAGSEFFVRSLIETTRWTKEAKDLVKRKNYKKFVGFPWGMRIEIILSHEVFAGLP